MNSNNRYLFCQQEGQGDAETDQILGAAILGLEGGEVMTVSQVAMIGKLPYTAIRDGAFAHPTLAESLNNLFMSFDS